MHLHWSIISALNATLYGRIYYFPILQVRKSRDRGIRNPSTAKIQNECT
jgi:hypothetical protein